MNAHGCVHECGSKRFILLSTLIFDAGTVIEPEMHRFSYTGWPVRFRDPSESEPLCGEYRCVLWYLTFYVGCGNLNCLLWGFVCMLSQQVNYLPSPCNKVPFDVSIFENNLLWLLAISSTMMPIESLR